MVVLTGLSHTKGRKQRCRESEKRVLRRTFEPKREGMAVGCRRPHNEELHEIVLGRSNQRG
jgi:hypothetical protein